MEKRKLNTKDKKVIKKVNNNTKKRKSNRKKGGDINHNIEIEYEQEYAN